MNESSKEPLTLKDKMKRFFSRENRTPKPKTSDKNLQPPLDPMDELRKLANNLPERSWGEITQGCHELDSKRREHDKEMGKSIAQGRVNSYEQTREMQQTLDEHFSQSGITVDRIPYWKINSPEKWQELFQTRGWSQLSTEKFLGDKEAVESYKELRSHATYETDKKIVSGVVDPIDLHQRNETTQNYINQVLPIAEDLRYTII